MDAGLRQVEVCSDFLGGLTHEMNDKPSSNDLFGKTERPITREEVSILNLPSHTALLLQTIASRSIQMFENSGFFVDWGTLSLINAGLAQSKGRGGLLWWLICLLLGSVATFLIVILAKETASS